MFLNLDRFRISGEWRGYYQYPFVDFKGPDPPPRVQFTMSLRESDTGVVTGEVVEEPPLGFLETGTIEGEAKLFQVSFRKLMPVLRLQDGETTVTLTDWLRRQNPVIEEVNVLPHPTVYFTARLFRWPGLMAGSWWVPETAIVDEDSPFRLDFPAHDGVWEARRVR